MSAALDEYRWLVSDAAAPWLAIAREELSRPRGGPRPRGVSAGAIARLRKDLTCEQAHRVVEQVELRRRGREKFSLAERMFFTRKGLEQATDEQIAAYKATRIPGPGVCDLCCGIGGDLIALAAGRTGFALDADETMALLAEHNCRVHDVHALVAVGRVNGPPQVLENSRLPWHIDPDRRSGGGRRTRLDSFEPPLEVVERLLAKNRDAAIKVAPATEVPASWKTECERQWLSTRGECRQQVAWFGALAQHPGLCSASVIDRSGELRTVVGHADEPVPAAAAIGRYVFEPDAAVLAAKLAGALCRQHSLAPLAAGGAYLTGDAPLHDPALAAFEVQDVLALDRKQLRTYCREHGLGRLEVKKRGVEIDPEKLRKEVVAEGDNEASLLVAPLGGKVRAIAARRLRREER